MNDIETFVRLKYTIPIDANGYYYLEASFPSLVIEKLRKRWYRFTRGKNISEQNQWKLYLRFLVEELCIWEQNNVTAG